jgi:hypothetical protein
MREATVISLDDWRKKAVVTRKARRARRRQSILGLRRGELSLVRPLAWADGK